MLYQCTLLTRLLPVQDDYARRACNGRAGKHKESGGPRPQRCPPAVAAAPAQAGSPTRLLFCVSLRKHILLRICTPFAPQAAQGEQPKQRRRLVLLNPRCCRLVTFFEATPFGPEACRSPAPPCHAPELLGQRPRWGSAQRQLKHQGGRGASQALHAPEALGCRPCCRAAAAAAAAACLPPREPELPCTWHPFCQCSPQCWRGH